MLVFDPAAGKMCFHWCCQNIGWFCGIMWDSSVYTKVQAGYLIPLPQTEWRCFFCFGCGYVSWQHLEHPTKVKFLLRCVLFMYMQWQLAWGGCKKKKKRQKVMAWKNKADCLYPCISLSTWEEYPGIPSLALLSHLVNRIPSLRYGYKQGSGQGS